MEATVEKPVLPQLRLCDGGYLMSAYKLSNGHYLDISHSSDDHGGYWDYTLFDENGAIVDGGQFDDDHYPIESTAIHDILSGYDMENETLEQVSDSIIDEFYEKDLEPSDRDIEMGFDPYLGCYTDDC